MGKTKTKIYVDGVEICAEEKNDLPHDVDVLCGQYAEEADSDIVGRWLEALFKRRFHIEKPKSGEYDFLYDHKNDEWFSFEDLRDKYE